MNRPPATLDLRLSSGTWSRMVRHGPEVLVRELRSWMGLEDEDGPRFEEVAITFAGDRAFLLDDDSPGQPRELRLRLGSECGITLFGGRILVTVTWEAEQVKVPPSDWALLWQEIRALPPRGASDLPSISALREIQRGLFDLAYRNRAAAVLVLATYLLTTAALVGGLLSWPRQDPDQPYDTGLIAERLGMLADVPTQEAVNHLLATHRTPEPNLPPGEVPRTRPLRRDRPEQQSGGSLPPPTTPRPRSVDRPAIIVSSTAMPIRTVSILNPPSPEPPARSSLPVLPEGWAAEVVSFAIRGSPSLETSATEVAPRGGSPAMSLAQLLRDDPETRSRIEQAAIARRGRFEPPPACLEVRVSSTGVRARFTTMGASITVQLAAPEPLDREGWKKLPHLFRELALPCGSEQ